MGNQNRSFKQIPLQWHGMRKQSLLQTLFYPTGHTQEPVYNPKEKAMQLKESISQGYVKCNTCYAQTWSDCILLACI